MSGLGSKVKGQLDIWSLYKTSVSLGLTFLSSIMISAWTVIEKWKFQEFSNINALGIKFGLSVKKVKVSTEANSKADNVESDLECSLFRTYLSTNRISLILLVISQ